MTVSLMIDDSKLDDSKPYESSSQMKVSLMIDDSKLDESKLDESSR